MKPQQLALMLFFQSTGKREPEREQKGGGPEHITRSGWHIRSPLLLLPHTAYNIIKKDIIKKKCDCLGDGVVNNRPESLLIMLMVVVLVVVLSSPRVRSY